MLAEERVVTPEGKETRRTEGFYEPESFVPLAKREAGGGTGVATKGSDGGAEEVRLWYVVTDHLGTPREMLSEGGSIVWAAEYTTWGSIRRLWQADNDDNPDGNFQGMGPDGNPVYSTRVYGSNGNVALKSAQTPDAYACPIRFQGQWADEETGLYYNRFRYYDPDAAQYTSSDPIGFAGGMRPHGYTSFPMTNVDPRGLADLTGIARSFADKMYAGGKCGGSSRKKHRTITVMENVDGDVGKGISGAHNKDKIRPAVAEKYDDTPSKGGSKKHSGAAVKLALSMTWPIKVSR